MDLIDVANDHAEYLLHVALHKRRSKRGGQVASAEYCDSCGVPIPELRREAVAGCQTCVDCQQLLETRRG